MLTTHPLVPGLGFSVGKGEGLSTEHKDSTRNPRRRKSDEKL